MFNTTIRDPDYLQTLVFLSAALLFLIVFGAGLGVYGAKLPEMVESGKMLPLAAWASFAAGIASFLFISVFMAHHLILFVNAIVRNDRKASSDRILHALKRD